MTGLDPTDRTQLLAELGGRITQAKHLAELITLATERLPHAVHLAALLKAGDMDAVLPPAGVSQRVADALLTDLRWIRADPPLTSMFPRAYHLRRAVDTLARTHRALTPAP